jgi:protein FrlC
MSSIKYCYSSNGFKKNTFEQTFKILSDLKYDGIEIAITEEHFPKLNLLKQTQLLNKLTAEFNLPITNIHVGEPFLLSKKPHFPSIISSEKSERLKKIDLIKESIEFANEINCQNITITSGVLEEGQNAKSAWHILLESIERSIELLYPKMQLLIEQEPEMLVGTTADLLQLIEDTKGRLKINLDIGHLQVNRENISKSIQLLKNSLVNIHFEDIKNNIHQHLLPGEGDIDFSAFFKEIKNISYSGHITADLYPFSHKSVEAAQFTQKFLNKFKI